MQPTASTEGVTTGADELDALLLETRSTRETAETIAQDGPSPDADEIRVLAGLVSHLAAQLERLGAFLGANGSVRPAAGQVEAGPADPDDAQEEDISPEEAPAEPARDPEATGDSTARENG